MELSEILSAISTVGFPIVACIAMYIRMDKSDARHSEEVEKLSEAINNNTQVMTRLSERIGRGNND